MFAHMSIAALFAGLAAAQHAPVGEPSGNPITRPLNEVVPACKVFTITWQPTTPNPVSLILLRGPSTNVVPLSTIVTGIANSGSYQWTPSSGLEADVTHYGLQLIDDVTGQYQYSTQFGISKDGACSGVAPSSAVSTPYGGGYPVSTPTPTPYTKPTPKPSSMDGYPVASSAPASSAVAPAPYSKPNVSTIVTMTSSAAVVVASGMPAGNGSIIMPTKSMTVPGSLLPSGASATKSSGLPESTGAASGIKAGLGLAGAAAAFAFML